MNSTEAKAMSGKHSIEFPLRVSGFQNGSTCVVDAGDLPICHIYRNDEAQQILQIVNSHEALVAALKELVESAESHDDAPQGNCLAEWARMRDALFAANQALALANGLSEKP